MASGPEHYNKAESLMEAAMAYDQDQAPNTAGRCRQEALIHAILAGTAATATLADVTAETTDMRHTDVIEWRRAIKPSAPVDSED